MRASRQLGVDGEAVAAARYEAEGYRILDRNWRCPRGEIDIVAARDGVVVFCEVKTRSSTRFGSPAEAVGSEKQARLRLLATLWLRERGRSFRELRFDVAAVTASPRGMQVQIIDAAF